MNALELKYPLILVHGIAAKDKLFFWGRIPKRLRKAGLRVSLGNTDSWGSIDSNARSLAETVDEVLDLYNSEKVNIIAHSKGGLDSRYLVSSLDYACKVASLTTIATPHLGSEIVDLIIDSRTFYNRTIYNPAAKKIIRLVTWIYGDRSPEPYAIIDELSTQRMTIFNHNNPNHPDIYYSSYLSLLRGPFDDISYFHTYSYLIKNVGENDGLISLQSARWGEDFTLIEGKKKGGISHSEITDLKRKKISGVDIPGEYLKIVKKLAEKGL